MASRIDRRTVDLSKYPDLVVIYLGMRVRKLEMYNLDIVEPGEARRPVAPIRAKAPAATQEGA